MFTNQWLLKGEFCGIYFFAHATQASPQGNFLENLFLRMEPFKKSDANSMLKFLSLIYYIVCFFVNHSQVIITFTS